MTRRKPSSRTELPGSARAPRDSEGKKTWEEPKLTFVEPKLTKHGSLQEITGFFGAFSP
jgi:hypothetical protein